MSSEDTTYSEELPSAKAKTVRITLDLQPEMHRFLRFFSIQNGIPSAMTMRCLLYMLETDINLAQRVVDEIFADEED